MSVRPIALAICFATVVFCLFVRRYSQADACLSQFYSQMLHADFSGARQSIDHAIRLCPTNARYYDWQGYVTSQNLAPTCLRGSEKSNSGVWLDIQEVRMATSSYLQALELNNQDAVAHQNLGWLEHLLGNDEAADQNWRAAIQIDPDNSIFRLSYGMFLEEAGKKQEAQNEYETAISISPSILDSQFFTRYGKRSKNMADGLVDHLTKKLQQDLLYNSDPTIEARLGKLFLFRGDYDRAAKLLEDASRQLPNLPLAWLNLGEVYEKQDQLSAAVGYYEKSEATESSLAEPYLPYVHMAEVELRNGQSNEAAENFFHGLFWWQRSIPLTAAHNNRIYIGPSQIIDDLLPTTLVWYTTPCVASAAWKGLSELYPHRRDYAQRADTCEDLPSPHSGW